LKNPATPKGIASSVDGEVLNGSNRVLFESTIAVINGYTHLESVSNAYGVILEGDNTIKPILKRNINGTVLWPPEGLDQAIRADFGDTLPMEAINKRLARWRHG
jgi:hypothetical protein